MPHQGKSFRLTPDSARCAVGPQFLIGTKKIAVLGVVIERCLIISRPIEVRKIQKFTFPICMISIIIAVIYTCYQHLTIVGTIRGQWAECHSWGCLLNKESAKERLLFMLVLSFGCTVMMIVFAIIFIRFRQKIHRSRNGHTDRSNALVIAVIINQVLIEILPLGITTILIWFESTNISEYVGPFIVTCATFDGTITTTIYSWTVKSTRRSTVAVATPKVPSQQNNSSITRKLLLMKLLIEGL
ncbi:hypothetical protein M3Y98_00064600 [Aphelenchoides besseyi]|nr:hypothetical protein M3Y98_00064600 [Aphelenchoides besseyi]